MAIDDANLDDSDLEVAFHSALSILNIEGYSVDAKFEPFSSVKSLAQLDRANRKISTSVSDAYRLASREVILGLALDLCGRLFRRDVDNVYTREFKRYSKTASHFRLSESIRMLRGRHRKENHAGEFFDLDQVGRTVFEKYRNILQLSKMPSLFWNDRGGRRILAFYDRAFDAVLVSRVFDSSKVPREIIEYLCYHEFLHAKYQPLYERGESKRVIVHSTAFRKDEKLFEGYEQADGWISRNMGRLH